MGKLFFPPLLIFEVILKLFVSVDINFTATVSHVLILLPVVIAVTTIKQMTILVAAIAAAVPAAIFQLPVLKRLLLSTHPSSRYLILLLRCQHIHLPIYLLCMLRTLPPGALRICRQ